MKELTRDQMKNVKGGDAPVQGTKCCWINDMTNCSICVPGGGDTCVSGAKAVEC